MNQILCSTGALIGRPNNRNIYLLDDLVKVLTCDGLEFMFYSDWYDKWEEVAEYLASLPMPVPVVHCQKTVGELVTQNEDAEALRKTEINAMVAEKVGAKAMVMHLWNGIISDSNFSHSLEVYPYLRDVCAKHGVDLLIENVLCNNATPMTRWVELYKRYPDIHFIFDTKMAEFHDELKLLYDPRYAWLYEDKHIRHYHVNDYGGGYMTWNNLKVLPVGAGHIDFKPFFELIKKIGYEGTMTVEATAFGPDGVVDTAMLNKCFEDIRKYLNSET